MVIVKDRPSVFIPYKQEHRCMFLKFIEMFFLAMFTKLFVATFYKSNTGNLVFKTDLFFQNDSKGVGKG